MEIINTDNTFLNELIKYIITKVSERMKLT